MPRTTPYSVPTAILTDQAVKTAALFKDDTDDDKKKLAAVGVTAATFKELEQRARTLQDLEHLQETQKGEAAREQAEASEAVQALIRWRLDDVLARARLAFDGDKRLIHFRTGQLRSQRAAVVAREARLLIDAVRRFKDDPAAKGIGLVESVAKKGEELLEALFKDDSEAERARTTQVETTMELREQEVELSDMLADVEKRAAVAFPTGSPGRRRYRMNVIREYVARQHGKGGVDPSAAVDVPDPAPEVGVDGGLVDG